MCPLPAPVRATTTYAIVPEQFSSGSPHHRARGRPGVQSPHPNCARSLYLSIVHHHARVVCGEPLPWADRANHTTHSCIRTPAQMRAALVGAITRSVQREREGGGRAHQPGSGAGRCLSPLKWRLAWPSPPPWVPGLLAVGRMRGRNRSPGLRPRPFRAPARGCDGTHCHPRLRGARPAMPTHPPAYLPAYLLSTSTSTAIATPATTTAEAHTIPPCRRPIVVLLHPAPLSLLLHPLPLVWRKGPLLIRLLRLALPRLLVLPPRRDYRLGYYLSYHAARHELVRCRGVVDGM